MHQNSLRHIILRLLGDGPQSLRFVLMLNWPLGSIRNRLSELRQAGLIEDTVTLTEEGRHVLALMSARHASQQGRK